MSELIQSLQEVTKVFERILIPDAVMGGLAVPAHGIPRPIYDVDFIISMDRQALTPLLDVVEDLGDTVPATY